MKEAVKWYRKAAEQGEANAQCGLGWCYRNGDGVVKDMSEAVKWYRKAAEQGEAIKYDAARGVAWSVGKDGKYYYQAIVKGQTAGSKASVDDDTQKYAFRLDAQPIGFSAVADRNSRSETATGTN